MYAHPLLRAPDMSSVPALLKPNRRSGAAARVEKILVPTDGSGSEDAALSHVVDLARAAPAVVHLLNVQRHVMAGDVTPFTTAREVLEARRRAGEKALARASRALAAARIAHTSGIALGAPATEIVRAAAAHACARIVMATLNTGLLRLLLRRSVAQRVVASAPVPVTLVKPGAARSGSRAHAGRTLRFRLCAWRKRSCAPAGAYRAA